MSTGLAQSVQTRADLAVVIDGVAAFIAPPLGAVARGEAFSRRWAPGGPWRFVKHGLDDARAGAAPAP